VVILYSSLLRVVCRWLETLLFDSVIGMDQFPLCIYHVLIQIFVFIHFIVRYDSLPFLVILGMYAFHASLALFFVIRLFRRSCRKLSLSSIIAIKQYAKEPNYFINSDQT
jgi:hypothetical protein